MPSFWIQTPSDNMLSDMRGWAQIGADKYAAIRHHLLVVERRDGKAKDGPVHKPVEWLINTEFTMEEKITNVTKYTLSIQESITSAVTTKLTQEVVAKIGLSTGLDRTNLWAKLNTEVQSKTGTELIDSLQKALSTTKTYEVETKTEQTESVKVKVAAADGSSGTRQVFIYFKLNQLFWDVYLYQTDYLQLQYKKSNLWRLQWRDIRNTIRYEQVLFRKPLFRVAYFEPVPAFSFRYDKYEPEVEDGNVVLSLPLTSLCPNANLQSNTSMEELARSAFPVSKAEKQRAKLERARRAKGGGRTDGKYISGGGVSKAARKGSVKGGIKSTTKAPSKSPSRKSSGSKGSSLRKGTFRSRGGSKGLAKKK